MVVFGTPGGRNGNEGRLQVDGLGVGAARNGGGVSGYNADIANAQEISFTVSAGLGEAEVSGPSLSVVPKTGGNSLRGRCSSPASAKAWSAATTPRTAGGGSRHAGPAAEVVGLHRRHRRPIKKDRLWYFLNLRNQGSHSSVAGMCAPGTPAIREMDLRSGHHASVAHRRQLDGRQPAPDAAGDAAQQVQHLLGRAEAVHRRDLFRERRRLPEPAERGRIRLRRIGDSRRKRPPTRIGSSGCSSSRGTRRSPTACC